MFGDEDSTPEIAAEMAIGFANWLLMNQDQYLDIINGCEIRITEHHQECYPLFTMEQLYKLYLESL